MRRPEQVFHCGQVRTRLTLTHEASPSGRRTWSSRRSLITGSSRRSAKEVLQVDYETDEDEDSLPGRLVKQVRHLLDVIDDSGPRDSAGVLERLEDLKAKWAGLKSDLREI